MILTTVVVHRHFNFDMHLAHSIQVVSEQVLAHGTDSTPAKHGQSALHRRRVERQQSWIHNPADRRGQSATIVPNRVVVDLKKICKADHPEEARQRAEALARRRRGVGSSSTWSSQRGLRTSIANEDRSR